MQGHLETRTTSVQVFNCLPRRGRNLCRRAGLQPPDGSAPAARPTVSQGQKNCAQRGDRAAEDSIALVRSAGSYAGLGFGPWNWPTMGSVRGLGFGPRACVTMGSVRGIAPWNWVRSAGLPENGFGPRIAPDWLRFVRRLGGIAQALRNNSCRLSLRERATSRSIPARMSKESWKNKEDSNHEGHKDHKELRIHP